MSPFLPSVFSVAIYTSSNSEAQATQRRIQGHYLKLGGHLEASECLPKERVVLKVRGCKVDIAVICRLSIQWHRVQEGGGLGAEQVDGFLAAYHAHQVGVGIIVEAAQG